MEWNGSRARGASSRRPCRERLGSPQIGSCLLFPERTTGQSPPFPRERRPTVTQLLPAPRQCRLQGARRHPAVPRFLPAGTRPTGVSAQWGPPLRSSAGDPSRRLPCEARRAGGVPDSNLARLRAARPEDDDGIAWSGLPRVPASCVMKDTELEKSSESSFEPISPGPDCRACPRPFAIPRRAASALLCGAARATGRAAPVRLDRRAVSAIARGTSDGSTGPSDGLTGQIRRFDWSNQAV